MTKSTMLAAWSTLAVVMFSAATMAAPPGPRTARRTATHSLRLWINRADQTTLRAELVDVLNGTVHLKKKDGTTVEVPLEDLDKGDQRYVRRTLPPLVIVLPPDYPIRGVFDDAWDGSTARFPVLCLAHPEVDPIELAAFRIRTEIVVKEGPGPV